MSLTVIAAVGRDGAIGRGGDLAYHISADLRRFKALTMGHALIMGRRTFLSLPGGALPGRRNIVLTRDPGFSAPGVETAPLLADAVAMAPDAYVIGGGQVYAAAMPLADRLEITAIDADTPDADTWFPAIGPEWTVAEASESATDPRSGLAYRFVTYRRAAQ